jgi:hypothetical protein
VSVGIDALLLDVDRALRAAGVPHAFGGAIALAYCTRQARGTIDLDVNIFVEAARAQEVFESLPGTVRWSRRDLVAAQRDEQVRLWAGNYAVDLFFSYAALHEVARKRVREVPFAGTMIPILDCTDLAVFKAMFDRTKDWADIEAALEAASLDLRRLRTWITRLTGADDPRHERLERAIRAAQQA